MIDECIDCPKNICCEKQDIPHWHAKLKYKDVDCNCEERMKLMKKIMEAK